ncbi:MAG: hypothetical protein E6076_04300 [Peptoniphilus harei]|uniref:hypothetical protein n=1 Tax=Peptoniphilus harei TaxID=54005 RepID=UPI00290DEC60|nr:hypothetical protein [Peptoniphilus harei]MDU5471046.1 hypothetical protein [Peptoniphilus harei]MDU6098980.1 hypothetical protein [Peptoniphilus harei]
MKDKKFKRVLIVMFIIFLAAIPLLYFLSDPRDQAVKEVENEFGIRLPKSVKRERELYKEPSFHGDGEAAILFSFDKNDSEEIKKSLKDYYVAKDDNKLSQIETCYLQVKKRGFDPSLDLNNEIYFKPTSEYIFAGMYGNFVALILDEDEGEILFLEWDT